MQEEITFSAQEMTAFLRTATEAAREAGALLKGDFGKPPRVDEALDHDIKLAIDVETQELITAKLLRDFPEHALLGEEGVAGDQSNPMRWVVDPLDGTVNYFYGIPHFCTSIALMYKFTTLVGVIYDPVREEIWQGTLGGQALLNDRPVRVSRRIDLGEAVATVGLSKQKEAISSNLRLFENLASRVRKMRMMGSAALELCYLASGRTDLYLERAIGLWDIAAGQVILDCAGGKSIVQQSHLHADRLSILAWNGVLEIPYEEVGIDLGTL